MKDLGVQITSDFKPSVQCAEAAKRANRALYQLTKTVASRKPEVLVPLYKAYVRPHLEYCVQAWNPILVKDKKTLEAVQRRFTRLFGDIRSRPYFDRLKALNLFSMERRRLRGDLIVTFKIIKGFSETGKQLFSLNTNLALRGHELKLLKPRAMTRLRANFISHRVINSWNKLPPKVVLATTVVAFKKLLDECWEALFPDLP